MTDNSSIDTSLTNIWTAWRAFRSGKKPSRDILRFQSDLESNLLQLCADVHTGNYIHAPYTHRIINEKKRRDIAVAQVRDRIVHRLLYDYMVPLLDKAFDPDVWSCRRGRGLHQCLDRCLLLAQRHKSGYVWRADISKFFDNIDHQVLMRCLRDKIHDPIAIRLLNIVITSYQTVPTQRIGVPIGNLTSQIFANVYLHEFDRYVRHVLKPLAYVRYGDDFMLFCRDRATALRYQQRATTWLADTLQLTVHPENNIVVKTRSGLHFLGHWLFSNGNLTIDAAMQRKMYQRNSAASVGNYKAMHITAKQRRILTWSALEPTTSFRHKRKKGRDKA